MTANQKFTIPQVGTSSGEKDRGSKQNRLAVSMVRSECSEVHRQESFVQHKRERGGSFGNSTLQKLVPLAGAQSAMAQGQPRVPGGIYFLQNDEEGSLRYSTPACSALIIERYGTVPKKTGHTVKSPRERRTYHARDQAQENFCPSQGQPLKLVSLLPRRSYHSDRFSI